MKLSSILHTNWLATFRLNYHAGGWTAVRRMPIRVYGPLKLKLRGKIILPANAHRNMVVINADFEDYTASACRAEVCILGTWQIDGFLRIGPDSCIYVHDEACLHLGHNIYIARDSRILCYKHITVGSDVRTTIFTERAQNSLCMVRCLSATERIWATGLSCSRAPSSLPVLW